MSYNYNNQDPYQQGPAQEGGYGYAQDNPYGQPNPYSQSSPYGQPNPYAQGDGYELQDYGSSNHHATNDRQANPTGEVAGGNPYGETGQSSYVSPPHSQQEFLNRVQNLRDEIKSLTNDIDYIGQLHQRSLSSTDGQASQQLEQYVSQTQIRNTAIKDGIKGLEKDLAKTSDGSRNTKKTQLDSLKTFFKSELDKYQSIERDYRQKNQEQIARQYRIVNPDATEEEVQEASKANWGDEGVFQTALRTNRTGHASSVLGNVRARHNDIQRIEQTLSELALLYNELATVVEQQDPVIASAEQNAEQTNEHIDSGIKEIDQANRHARRTRKMKWWCLLIVVLIILAVGLGVGLGVGLAKSTTNKRR